MVCLWRMFKVTLLSPPKSFPSSLYLSPNLNLFLSHPILPYSFFSSFHLYFSLMRSIALLPPYSLTPLAFCFSSHEGGKDKTAADIYVTNSACLCHRGLFLACIVSSHDHILYFQDVSRDWSISPWNIKSY